LAPTHTGDGHFNPTSVAVSPDGHQVWVSDASLFGSFSARSAQASDLIWVFNAATGTPLAKIAVGAGPYFMVLSHNGHHAFVAEKVTCDVRQIDTSTYQVVATVTIPVAYGCPFGLAASTQSGVAYAVTGNDHTINAGTQGNALVKVDFTKHEPIVHPNVGTDPVSITLSSTGTTAYVVDADRPVIEVVDTATGSITSTLALPPASRRTTTTSIRH
jgi:DNA-binding beta-propeller fold protein YncE